MKLDDEGMTPMETEPLLVPFRFWHPVRSMWVTWVGHVYFACALGVALGFMVGLAVGVLTR